MQDFIEGVDNVQIRKVIDDVSNRNGDLLIEFLIDCNMCMVNGRIGSQDFTNISLKGKSVVDYVLTPHEQIFDVIDFKVHTMTDVMRTLNLLGYDSIPDHSILEWTIKTATDMVNVNENDKRNKTELITAPRRFKMDKLSASELFEDEYMQNLLQETIEKMETAINRRRNVDKAFGGLKHLLMSELERSCKEIRQNVTNDKPHKKSRKPYWNKDLDELWEQVCEAERQWKRCKSSSKSRLRSIFVETRKDFDKLNRKIKRKYQADQQDKLHKLG